MGQRGRPRKIQVVAADAEIGEEVMSEGLQSSVVILINYSTNITQIL